MLENKGSEPDIIAGTGYIREREEQTGDWCKSTAPIYWGRNKKKKAHAGRYKKKLEEVTKRTYSHRFWGIGVYSEENGGKKVRNRVRDTKEGKSGKKIRILLTLPGEYPGVWCRRLKSLTFMYGSKWKGKERRMFGGGDSCQKPGGRSNPVTCCLLNRSTEKKVSAPKIQPQFEAFEEERTEKQERGGVIRKYLSSSHVLR